jgi:MYXO-CTERM domain-containing protein
VAGIFTLFNLTSAGNAWPYAHASSFFDVTSGSNGKCDEEYGCTAGSGYDGPTGLGTPNGAALAVEALKTGEQVTAAAADPPPGGMSQGCSVAAAPGQTIRPPWPALVLGAILARRRMRGHASPVRTSQQPNERES